MDRILFFNVLIALFCTLFIVLNGIRLLPESTSNPAAKAVCRIAHITNIYPLQNYSFVEQICLDRPHLTCQHTRAGTPYKPLNIKPKSD